MAKPDKPKSKPSLQLPEVEPCSEPVSVSEVLASAVDLIRSYMVLSDTQALAVALWCLHAHAHDAASISPRLAIISPEKQCGKTTLLSIVSALVQRPLQCANITAAAVFRTVEHHRPTLLIDEADTFLNEHEELRGILNSGHNRASAQVIRLVGEQHEPTVFNTWTPVAIAAIKDIPDTLMDRSVVIRLRRKLPDEKVERLRLDRMQPFSAIARQMARVVQDNFERLAEADPPVPDSLSDRAQDNWRPLLALADLAGSEWGGNARAAAIELSATSDEDEASPSVMLLEDMLDIMHRERVDRITSHELMEELNKLEDRPWREWKRGFPLTANSAARLLKPFAIRPKKLRFGSQTQNGYERGGIEEAVSRYGRRAHDPAPSGTPEQVSNVSYLDDVRTGTGGPSGEPSGTSKHLIGNDCSVVLDASGWEKEL